MATPTSPDPDYLGELTCAAAWSAFYPLGELIAQLNSGGTLVHHNFGHDIVLNAATGGWVVHNADHLAPGRFSPERAAGQFQRFAGAELRALLSGYAPQAQRLLDPRHPGFTAGLLAELLPAPVPAVLQPSVSDFDLGRVFQACGASLHLSERECRLVLVVPTAPAAPVTDDELLLASGVVLVAELDLTAWLRHVAACYPGREVAQLLGSLARGALYPSTWGGVVAQLVASLRPARQREQLRERLRAYRAWSLLQQLFGEVYAHPDRLPEIENKGTAFRYLRYAVDQLPAADAPQRWAVLLAVRDGLEWLARTADTQGDLHASLNYAQSALIIAQMLQPALEPAAAEAWLLHVAAQEAGYSWFWRPAGPPPAPALVWPLAGYAGSVGLTVRVFGEASVQWLKQGRVSNQFWAAAWRALHLMRGALHQCHTLSEAEIPVEQRSGRAAVLQLLVTRYSQILRLLLDMAINDAETNQELSMWARAGRDKIPLSTLRAEYPGRCVAVLDALAAHGYGPAATQRLGELVSAWPL